MKERKWGRLLASGLATAALAALLAALSGIPYGSDAEASAALRLSWRTRAAAVRECRDPTADELARLPAHMRRERVCDWRVPPHRLRVVVDGEPREDGRIEAAGARRDRPLYVHREFSLSPGPHRLEVEFFPERESDVGQSGVRLELRADLDLDVGDVALVTYDPDAGELALRRAGDR